MKILGMEVDDKIILKAFSKNLTIFGCRPSSYKSVEELRLAIEEMIKEEARILVEEEGREERIPQEPTHKDINVMLKDIYEYSKQHPKFEIIAADDSFSLLVGYVVGDMSGGQDESRRFHIRLTDLKTTVNNNESLWLWSKLNTSSGRKKLGTKKALAAMFGRMRK